MYKDALRPVWVEINLRNLAYNIENIKKKVGNKEVIGVIKADAYGHGSLQVAQVLREHGIKTFAVATISEGIVLRECGAKEDIICLGLTPDMYADSIVKYDLIPAFCTYKNALAFNDAAKQQNKVARGIVAVDTGMGRIGYTTDQPKEAANELLRIQELGNFEIAGLFSHLSSADEVDMSYTQMQLQKYKNFINIIKNAGVVIPKLTLANSASIMKCPDTYFDAVRAGIILYGQYPSESMDKSKLNIKPVMSVKANITNLKTVPQGTSISYGRRYVSTSPAKIATLNLGYADGFPRSYSSKARVIVNGVICPVAGNICMDQCMIDVTEVPDVKIGDEVIIMGTDGKNSITADYIAQSINTINYEVLCNFGRRLPNVYLR